MAEAGWQEAGAEFVFENPDFDKPIQQSVAGSNTNTAIGTGSLNDDTIGTFNTACGQNALQNNTSGGGNTAIGNAASQDNTTGAGNTACGENALAPNTTGRVNTACGNNALGSFNDTTGANDNNVAVGYQAAYNYTGTERNNIVIGANVTGTAGESNMIRIGAQVYGQQAGTSSDYMHINGTMQASAWQTTQSAAVAPTAITVGASPFTFKNTAGQNLIVYVSGGVVTAVALSGVTTGLTSGTFYLGPNDTLQITYSTAPTMLSKAL